MNWNFDNSYARLPEGFFQRVEPTPVREPSLLVLNSQLAQSLGLETSGDSKELATQQLAGNVKPGGGTPLAQAYAGHQFGGFTMLGDGRAILLGEHITPSGERLDVQLKGSGRTAFSRSGDGRAVVGPMLREYVISEAMAALGIPSTRSLAVIATGEPVFRDSMLPGAVLTRIATSHLRVGTFQYALARRFPDDLRTLTEYAIARHDPELIDDPDRYVEFLRRVMERQARLIASWMLVGFVHGVMNTDNVSIAGETIDYGPCAFMDRYDPATVFSSIDSQGRYAYQNQPAIGEWNIARFAETMLPLISDDQDQAIEIATETIRPFADCYQASWLTGMSRKLGLVGEDPDDSQLIDELLDCMQDTSADWTNTFRSLCDASVPWPMPEDHQPSLDWRNRWNARLTQRNTPFEQIRQSMREINPAVIPRNERVQHALDLAESGDMEPFDQLLAQVTRPFRSSHENEYLRQPPAIDTPAYRTFCGT